MSRSLRVAPKHIEKEIQEEFACVIWRSLRNPPSISELLADLLQFLSPQLPQEQSDNVGENISRLLQCLRNYRCLLGQMWRFCSKH